MNLSHLTSFVVITVVLLVATSASAEDDYDEMIELSNAAAEAVGEQHYEIGAAKFRQAYRSYPDPVLLNNEMIAWYRADDCRNALRPARDFLELGDSDEISSQDRQNVRTVLVDCHLELSEEAFEDGNAALAGYHLDAVEPVDRSDEEEERYRALRERLTDQTDTAVADAEPPPQTAASPNFFGWAQISGGLLVAATGAALHSVALNRQSVMRDLEERGQAALLEARKEEWGGFQNTTRWAVPALYLLGAAAIGSGTYFVLTGSSDGTDTTALHPSVFSDGATLTLSGRF